MATLQNINSYTWIVAWTYNGEYFSEYFDTESEAIRFMDTL